MQSDLLCIEAASRAPEESLGYFLRQLPMSDAARTVTIKSREPASSDPWPSVETTPLIVASHDLRNSDLDALYNYIEHGGHLMWVWDAVASGTAGDINSKPFDYAVAIKKLAEIGRAHV